MKVQTEIFLKKDCQLSRSKRKLSASMKANAASTEQAQTLKDRIEQWKAKYHLVVDSLAESTKVSDVLRDEIDEWKENAKRM